MIVTILAILVLAAGLAAWSVWSEAHRPTACADICDAVTALP
jgi:hypothetical protein